MDLEEFKARALEVTELDKDLGRQLRQLYVDRGTLQQLVRAILDQRRDLQEALSKNLIVTEESIRVAIGMQGQILGIDNVLDVILTLMNTEAENEHDTESERRAP